MVLGGASRDTTEFGSTSPLRGTLGSSLRSLVLHPGGEGQERPNGCSAILPFLRTHFLPAWHWGRLPGHPTLEGLAHSLLDRISLVVDAMLLVKLHHLCL